MEKAENRFIKKRESDLGGVGAPSGEITGAESGDEKTPFKRRHIKNNVDLCQE